MNSKIVVNVTGCALVDNIFSGINFNSKEFQNYLSLKKGDGGLVPGQLTLSDDLYSFSGKTVPEIINDLITSESKNERSIGGPAVVALVAASQLLNDNRIEFSFFQNHGNDSNGRYLVDMLNRIAPSISLKNYYEVSGSTAQTVVLSDSCFNNGNGERTFINSIATAGIYEPSNLDHNYFDGDILLFGATALTPSIHNDLKNLLMKGHESSSINIVTTVFDFINDKKHDCNYWPLGKDTDSYKYIDLLITDAVEALSLTGCNSKEAAVDQFKKWGLSALIITDGVEDIIYSSSSDSLFLEDVNIGYMQTLKLENFQLKDYSLINGDTTGCGDNFAGGVLAYIINQTLKSQRMNIKDAIILGNAVGASACYHLGGVMKEKSKGKKMELVDLLYKRYKNEIFKGVSYDKI